MPNLCPSLQFKKALTSLHNALKVHMPGPDGSKPQRTDPGLVQQIFVSVFGFSRGAAEARVFSRWLIELCKMDARMLGKPGMTLAGFPVIFDFLGVLDTVASVGLANTIGFFNGHGSWADSEYSMRVMAAWIARSQQRRHRSAHGGHRGRGATITQIDDLRRPVAFRFPAR